VTVAFRAMNTDVLVILPRVHPMQEEIVTQPVRELFARAEHRFSRFLADSEVSRVSASHSPMVVSAELFEALRRARCYWELTDGWFDVTVCGALRAAGYDRSFAHGVLDRTVPACVRSMVTTSEDIVLDAATRTVELRNGATIDCGGFVKGWTVDRAGELLPSPCAVDAGGDAVLRGAGPAGAGWRVDVEDPAHLGRVLISFHVTDQAIATSGNSRRHWRVGNMQMHHLVDPHTGQPGISDLAQVTVVAPSAELADVLAKTVFLRGRRDGCRFLDRFADVGAVLVLRDGRIEVYGEVA
jgi:FAD:protein FMN transferase